MKRLAALILALGGAALILVAGFGILLPAPVTLAPAAFSEALWLGPVPALTQEPVYAPSDEIRQAARLESAGIWPLSHSWYLYAPKSGKPRHVIVLLHGGGRDGLSMLEMWKATADRHDLLLVAPNGGALRFSALGRYAVTAAARQTAAAHGLAEDGLFLFGHSDGAALAAAMVASAAPGQWQAAAFHAGYLPADELSAGSSSTPLRLYLGDADPIFPTDPARASLQSLARAGHPSELVTLRGHGHWFYVIGPAIAESSWLWFDSLQP